jgi:hypothetical protein
VYVYYIIGHVCPKEEQMRECTSQVMTLIDWMEVLYFTGYNFYTHFTLSALGDNTHPNVYGSNYYPDLLHFL